MRPAFIAQRVAEIEAGVAKVRVGRDGLRDHGASLAAVAALVGHDARKLKGIGIARIDLEDRRVELVGGGEPAIPMQPQGQRQRIIEFDPVPGFGFIFEQEADLRRGRSRHGRFRLQVRSDFWHGFRCGGLRL